MSFKRTVLALGLYVTRKNHNNYSEPARQQQLSWLPHRAVIIARAGMQHRQLHCHGHPLLGVWWLPET